MDMAYTVEQFLDFLKEEEKSDATISKYTYELQMFLQFFRKKGDWKGADDSVPHLSQQ